MGFSLGKFAKNFISFEWLNYPERLGDWWLDLFKPKQPKVSTESGVKTNHKGTDFVIPVVYGTRRIGGNVVYINTTGAHNKYLHMVLLLAQGECEGLYQVDGVDQVFIDDKIFTEYGVSNTPPAINDNVYYEFFSGASSQAVCSTLVGYDSNWDGTYLNDYCYLYLKFTWKSKYFKGIPTVNVVLQGKKLYDPRTGLTSYSENAVLAARDYMVNTRYGWGVPTYRVDSTSIGSAATYFGTTKGWAFSKVYNEERPAHDIVQDIFRYFRGSLVWDSYKYYFRYADTSEESIAMELSYETNIVDGSESLTVPSRFSSVNRAEITWIDAPRKYVEDKIYILATDEYTRATDYRDLKLDLTGCGGVGLDADPDTNNELVKEMIQELGAYYLERAYTDRSYGVTVFDEAVKLQPHDLVEVTSDEFLWDGKVFRVQQHDLQIDGSVGLSLVEETDDLYDQIVNVNLDDLYSLNFPSITDEPPAVENPRHTESLFGYRGRRFTRWKIQFDRPTDYPWFKHVEVWYSEDNVTWEFLYNVTTDFNIDNVYEGQDYWVRLRVVSIHDVKQDPDFEDTGVWVNTRGLNTTIGGNLQFPQSIVGTLKAIVGDNSINLYADPVDDDDIEAYEFRLFGWSGGIFLASSSKPNYSLKMVKPGTHSFYVNTKSNNGVYGQTPAGVTIALPNPPLLWTTSPTLDPEGDGDVHDDYSGGTHNNTEVYNYGGTDYLRRVSTISSSSSSRSSESSSVSSESSSSSSVSSESSSSSSVSSESSSSSSSESSSSSSSSSVHSSSSSSSESSSSSSSSESSSSSSESSSSSSVSSESSSSSSVSSESSSSSSVSSESSSGSSAAALLFVTDESFEFFLDSAIEWMELLSESSSASSGVSSSSSSSESSVVSSSSSSESSSSSSESSSSSSESSSSSSESSISSESSSSSSESSSSSSESSSSSSSSSLGILDSLTGVWTSGVYDLGATPGAGTYLAWIEADITVLGAGTQWDSQFPAPDTWTDGGVDRTWGQIFAFTEASTVRMAIKHSNSLDGGALSNPTTIEKLEVLGTMYSARYFQVEVTIIDPSESTLGMVESLTVKFRSPT